MRLKRFITTGVALSTICVATLAEAAFVTVTNSSNAGPGSLRAAIDSVNGFLSPVDEIRFNAGYTINLTSALPAFTRSSTVKIVGQPTLKIKWGDDDLTKDIFTLAGTPELYLVGKGAGENSNWYGSISGSAGATIRFEQEESFVYPGIVSGDVAVICQGALQTLTFGNTNTYTGDTSIPSGTLAVGIDDALPTSGTVNTTGGILAIGNGFSQTLAKVTGTGSVNNAGTLEIDSGVDSVFDGDITGSGNVAKKGTGTFELTKQSTYTGTTEIFAGTLKSNAALGNALPATNAVTISDNATLKIADGMNQTLQSIAGDGEVAIDNAATLTAATIADGSFAGSITATGTGNFVKNGTNTLTLSGSAPNTGALQISGGGIKIPTGGTWDGPVTIDIAALKMDGGTVTDAITGTGLGSVLEITKDFTPVTDITDMGFVNVRSGGTFFLTHDIAGATGSLLNEGDLTHTASATRAIPEDFTQEGTGTINIGITDLTHYSQLQVNGTTTLNGGTMNVQIPANAQINTGDVFDVINSAGGIVNNTLPTVPKASLFLGFRPVVTGNILQLVANRSGCMCINTIPPLKGIAEGVDNLREDEKFAPLIDALTTADTSQSAFENKLEQLAPTGLNRMHVAVAEGAGASDQALLRLDAMRMGNGVALARTGYLHTGYAAGDGGEEQGSYGPMIFGNSTKQSSVLGLSGYKATTAGFGFLGDAPVAEHFRVGLGVSYGNSVVRQANGTGSYTKIGSTQGMLYGSAHYGIAFLDAVLSAGMNNYHGKRNVVFMGPSATSRYTGFQYGAKVKTGFAIPCYQAEISPMVGLQYMHLNTGKYTEKGADALLNQQTNAMRTSTVRASLGGRVMIKNQANTLFPEIHAFYLRDLKNPAVIITSRFVEGGGSFQSTTIIPPKNGMNVGTSMTALLSDCFALSGGYDLEAKKSFKSHSVSLKFKFLF